MDIETGLHGSEEKVTGDDRPLCHLVESPLFTVFFALPRSECCGYGRLSSELRRISGVCFSTLVPDFSRSEETPLMTLIAPLWPQSLGIPICWIW